jgi:hypothetical protein
MNLGLKAKVHALHSDRWLPSVSRLELNQQTLLLGDILNHYENIDRI